MKNRKSTHLALLVSLAASPLVVAQKPADQTAPEQAEGIVEAPPPATAVEKKAGKELASPAVRQGPLTDLVSDSLAFSTLKAVLKAAELDVTPGQKGTYTLFAPTDEAFDKLPLGMLGKLMLPENKEKLRSLLLYHVIPGQLLAADLKDGDVKTMNGEKVEIDGGGGRIGINDAKVFTSDVMANNGVLHSIDKVMIPKSLAGFSPLDK